MGPEGAVELLQLLSTPVRMELDYEVHSPTLAGHPFFAFYKRMNPLAVRQVCHRTINRVMMHRGDVLFCDGEIPAEPKMYFLLSGLLQYLRERSQMVHSKDCLCEPSLWVKQWVTRGTASATLQCHLLCIDAATFQNI